MEMLELYKMKKKDPKKRAIAKEERTTLIGRNGKPTPAPSQRKKTQQQQQPPLTLTRMMRYLALTFSSAVITFWVLRRESQVLRWDELHSVLQPEEKEGHRCYVSVCVCVLIFVCLFRFQKLCLPLSVTNFPIHTTNLWEPSSMTNTTNYKPRQCRR